MQYASSELFDFKVVVKSFWCLFILGFIIHFIFFLIRSNFHLIHSLQFIILIYHFFYWNIVDRDICQSSPYSIEFALFGKDKQHKFLMKVLLNKKKSTFHYEISRRDGKTSYSHNNRLVNLYLQVL